jgi:hypothetical protein
MKMKKLTFAFSMLLLTAQTYSFAIFSLHGDLLSLNNHKSLGSYAQEATLVSTIPGLTPLGDAYGINIYAKDDFLFVDAPVASTSGKDGEGAVYVYKNSNQGWINTQILTTNGTLDHFGANKVVKINNWLFVAALGTPIGSLPVDTPQNFSGSIRIYRLNPSGQFVFVQTIDRSTPGLEDLTFVDPTGILPPNVKEQGAAFGISFDIDENDNILLVGAPSQANIDHNLQPLINTGKVYSFKFNLDMGVFTLMESFTNPDGLQANDGFGACIRINKNYALISNAALFTDPHLNGGSSVYVYKFDGCGWNFVHSVQGTQIGGTLLQSPFVYGGPVSIGDNFGTTIAFDGNWAVIGAPYENANSNTLKGAAYFFKFQSVPNSNDKHLVFNQKVVSDDPNALFTGLGVGLDGNLAAIGDPLRTGPAGEGQGGVLAFYNMNGTWTNEAVLYDSTGASFQMLGSGAEVKQNRIFAGTGGTGPMTAVLLFFFNPQLNPNAPIPATLPNKVAIFKRT